MTIINTRPLEPALYADEFVQMPFTDATDHVYSDIPVYEKPVSEAYAWPDETPESIPVYDDEPGSTAFYNDAPIIQTPYEPTPTTLPVTKVPLYGPAAEIITEPERKNYTPYLIGGAALMYFLFFNKKRKR